LCEGIKAESYNKDVGSVQIHTDYKLMLYRHWTFFDSLKNSNYIVSRLETYKEAGEKLILRFLVTVGLSLEDANQKYAYIDGIKRKHLREKIMEATSYEFSDLADILIDCFLLQLNENTQITSMDYAHAITNLLEYPLLDSEQNCAISNWSLLK